MSKPKIITPQDKIAFWRGTKRSDDGDQEVSKVVVRSVELNANQLQQPAPGPQPGQLSGGQPLQPPS